MVRVYFEPLAVVKYIHCGACWKVLGEIPASEPDNYFDTFDCGWPCECERLNLSSDGLVKVFDSKGNLHFIFARGDYDDKESELLEKLREGFNFDKNDFKPERAKEY